MSEDLAVSWFTQLRTLTGSDEVSILLLLASAVLAAVALHAGAFALMRRFFAGEGMARAILKRIAGPTRLAAILLALVIVLPAAEFNSEFGDTVRRLMNAALDGDGPVGAKHGKSLEDVLSR
jgi:hypothetical protein